VAASGGGRRGSTGRVAESVAESVNVDADANVDSGRWTCPRDSRVPVWSRCAPACLTPASPASSCQTFGFTTPHASIRAGTRELGGKAKIDPRRHRRWRSGWRRGAIRHTITISLGLDKQFNVISVGRASHHHMPQQLREEEGGGSQKKFFKKKQRYIRTSSALRRHIFHDKVRVRPLRQNIQRKGKRERERETAPRASP
jgi:hypothetical protein